MQDWHKKHREISEVLNEYGWFVPSYMMGSDFERLLKVVKQVQEISPKTDEDRSKAESLVYLSMMDVIFHPNYRARLLWHGMKVPHFQEFSHIIEKAVFAYYKREYAASILLLLCALEGILRSWSGITNPTFPQLKKAVRDATLSEFYPNCSVEHAAYRDALSTFIEHWIYRQTKDADFSISVLNRHYVMHGKEAGNFYRPQDMHRMMLAMDLLLDFMSYSTGIFERAFLPEEGADPKFDSRRNYYMALSEGDQTFKQTWRTEPELLNDHKNYAPANIDLPGEMTHRLIGIMDYMAIMRATKSS